MLSEFLKGVELVRDADGRLATLAGISLVMSTVGSVVSALFLRWL